MQLYCRTEFSGSMEGDFADIRAGNNSDDSRHDNGGGNEISDVTDNGLELKFPLPPRRR